MLVTLIEIPKTPDEWSRWAWAHRTSHDKIRQAVLQQKSINLTDYVIDPIPPNNTDDWLANNAALHTDMNEALGLQSVDLESVEMKDPGQLAAWVWSHYLEHQSAEKALGV